MLIFTFQDLEVEAALAALQTLTEDRVTSGPMDSGPLVSFGGC